MAINKISGQTLAAMRRKSAAALPDRPSQRGYTAEDIRQAMVACLLDPGNSMAAELDRVVNEANEHLDNAMKKTWVGVEALGRVGWFAHEDGTYSYSISREEYDDSTVVLLIPADDATRKESQRIELYVESYSIQEDGHAVIRMRCNEGLPLIALKYISLVLRLNERPEGFSGAACFLGVSISDEPVPTAVDLSGMDTTGEIVETFSDGSSKTTTLEYDIKGNPIKITDGDGNVTTVTW